MMILRASVLTSSLVLFALLLCACGDDGGGTDSGLDGEVADSGTDGQAADAADSGADAGVPGVLPPVRAGTRLFAQTRGGYPIAFIDTLLDIECEFQNTEDGTIRCLPAKTLQVFYLDSGCETPVVAIGECEGFAEGDSAVRRVELPACGTPAVAPMRLGSVRAVASIYQKQPDGSCEVQEVHPTVTIHAVEDVPESDYVSATRVVANLTEAVGISHFVGEDGSVRVDTLIDRALDIDCRIEAGGDTGLCVPTKGGRYFSEGRNLRTSDCSEALAYEVPCHPADYPDIATSRSPPTGCRGTIRIGIVRTGAEVPIAEVVRGSADMCPLASEPSPSQRYFRVTEQIPEDQIVTTSRLAVGTDRARPYWWSLDGSTPLVPGNLHYDSESDLDCRGREIAGEFRCVPTQITNLPREPFQFSDSLCSIPVVPIFDTDECAAELRQTLQEQGAVVDTCPPRTRRFFEGVAVASGEIYMRSVDDCFAATPAENTTYFAVGAEIAVEDFALLDLVEIR